MSKFNYSRQAVCLPKALQIFETNHTKFTEHIKPQNLSSDCLQVFINNQGALNPCHCLRGSSLCTTLSILSLKFLFQLFSEISFFPSTFNFLNCSDMFKRNYLICFLFLTELTLWNRCDGIWAGYLRFFSHKPFAVSNYSIDTELST